MAFYGLCQFRAVKVTGLSQNSPYDLQAPAAVPVLPTCPRGLSARGSKD